MKFFSSRFRLPVQVIAIAALLTGSVILGTNYVSANHPVFVEGNCNNPPAGNPTPPGTVGAACGDFDGDGVIGTAEDTDGDRVFGTINGANSAAGANNNGTITIVTSGTFAEQVVITGNVTLQAAPGVSANIDAVLQGDSGSGPRQGVPGIIVNAPANRFVVIRNIMSKNWTSGIQINGDSRVSIQDSKFENNINYGIEITGNARVSISTSTVNATGFRLNPATGDFPTTSAPNPGIGIEFDGNSAGTLFETTVTGSFRAGVSVPNGRRNQVCVFNSNVFDNHPNFFNVMTSNTQCDVRFPIVRGH